MEIFIQIAAIFASPIVALLITSRLALRKEKQSRRQQIFEALWKTRGDSSSQGYLSPQRIGALNMIDIEFWQSETDVFFEGKSTTAVLRTWHDYRNHLSTTAASESQEDRIQWNVRSRALFLAMLAEMSQVLGYALNREVIDGGAYAPDQHLLNDARSEKGQNLLFEILEGKRALPIAMSPRVVAPSKYRRTR